MLNELYHSLNPVAISLGPVSIRWYALAYLAGFVLAGVVMYRVARRWGLGLSGYEVSNVGHHHRRETFLRSVLWGRPIPRASA